ncbi:MAG: HD domain-containing phosphohydrolase [Bdellovibrionales bacterium]
MNRRNQGAVVIPIRPQSDRRLASSSELGRLLSQHETGEVLDLILEKAVQNINAEGGSIYFIQDLKQESFGGTLPRFHKVLRFYRSINIELNKKDLHTSYIGIDNKSIAGYVALTGEIVRLNDCYKLPKETPYRFDDTFDLQSQYRTKSVLSVPIKSSSGSVIGVVQLVNKRTKKRNAKTGRYQITSFSLQDAQLIEALASQTAIALENAKLSSDIANLFESFVRASVTAIESRDPTTSGHSDRVAAMTVALAKVVDQTSYGPFRQVKFSPQQLQEIRYASLLHDFGKIGVRENLLLKAKKLFPNELEVIMLRIDSVRAKHETQMWKGFAEHLIQCQSEACKRNDLQLVQQPEQLYLKTQEQLDQYNRNLETLRSNILKANESQVMDGDFDIESLIRFIQTLSQQTGQLILSDNETLRLSIKRGTLSNDERKQIESHVSHTFQFLRQIAWTDALSSVPNIAHAHHEKLDGTGYPLGLKKDQIPLQSRMMAISDIYDALTAMDRPYKRAVSQERAIEILHIESKQGKLDTELLKIFIESAAFKEALKIDKIKRSA